MTGAVAKRYARAVFAIGAEAGDSEVAGQELARLTRAFSEEPLRAFAEDTMLDRTTRRTIVARVAEQLVVPRLIANFLGVLAQNNRLRALPAIAREYQRLEDRRLGRIRVRVRSARPLSEDGQHRLHRALEQRTGKQVIPETQVDADLLGGVVVEVQGRVFDGSLRAQLDRLNRSLSG